jgi:hypothetical protein
LESPDRKNVYDGVVVLNDKSEAEVELPDWFGALNKDFSYQLPLLHKGGSFSFIGLSNFLLVGRLIIELMSV